LEEAPPPDTRELLAALVANPRFQAANWAILKELLTLSGQLQGGDLVATRTIYDFHPNRRNPDQAATLAAWRNLLRKNFDVPESPSPTAPTPP
jgi:hypothetical protein